jgi:Ca-activated chloride channel family protein
MTQFTSFVAVEEKTITKGGQPVTIQVPVEMPAGVSKTGVFGEKDEERSAKQAVYNGRLASPGFVRGIGGGVAGGYAPGTAYSQPAVPSSRPMASESDVKTKTDAGHAREGQHSGEQNKLSDKVLGKMDATVQSAYNCWSLLPAGATAANATCPGASAGRIKVMLTLTDASEATLRKLKSLGFTVDATSGTSVLGSIALEKLAALAELDAVKNITAAPGVRAGQV